MSFPSVGEELHKRGLDSASLTSADLPLAQEALLAAIRRDCAEGVAYMHARAHESIETGQGVEWKEDPNSPLGKQLSRLHASDPVRKLVQEHFCHGQQLTFVNCCGGKVGGQKPKDDELVIYQIQSQAGPIAFADC